MTLLVDAYHTQCNSQDDDTPAHYFMNCTKYTTNRQELLQGLRQTVTRLDMDTNNKIQITNLLIRGHPDLTSDENFAMFNMVQNYINNTKRFNM